MSSIKHYQRHNPGTPRHTCPDIDDVIATMEKLRKANDELRNAAEYWENAATDIASELDAALETIGNLEGELSELQSKEAA